MGGIHWSEVIGCDQGDQNSHLAVPRAGAVRWRMSIQVENKVLCRSYI